MQGTQYCSAIAQTRSDTTTTRIIRWFTFANLHVGRNFTPLSPICSPSRVAVTFPKQDVTPLGPGSSTNCHLQFNLPLLLFQTLPLQKHCTTFPICSILRHQVSKLKPKLVSPNPFFRFTPIASAPSLLDSLAWLRAVSTCGMCWSGAKIH